MTFKSSQCENAAASEIQPPCFLHPGPLPKEREDRLPRGTETDAAGSDSGRQELFPLPGGEGQGEGKGGTERPLPRASDPADAELC